VNDITDENGRISQDYLIEKLKNKINIFSEFSRLKKAIPKEWYVQLSEEKSVKTTINIKKENIISVGRVINMDKLVNKDFYNIIKNKVFVKPIGIHFWTTYLDIQDFQNIKDLYTAGNRHKQNSRFCKEIREDNFRFWWRRVHEDALQGMYMSKKHEEIC
jgi:hypothetical protein